MHYNFVAYSFHRKKRCSRLSSSKVRFFAGNYNDRRLRLVGKRVADYLLVLIDLFWLGHAAKALRAIIGSKSAISLQRWLVDPKFQVEGVAPPTILLLRKLD